MKKNSEVEGSENLSSESFESKKVDSRSKEVESSKENFNQGQMFLARALFLVVLVVSLFLFLIKIRLYHIQLAILTVVLLISWVIFSPYRFRSLPEKSGSKARYLAWLPFAIVFTFILFLLIASFVPFARFNIPIQIEFHSSESYVQLGILAILLMVSLFIPVWLASLEQEKKKTTLNHPLGLPQGSVRALITLILALTYAILVIKQNNLEDAKNVLLLALAFYFISRATEKKEEND